MIKTISLQPGITLRCCTDNRLKTNCLSVQLVRPMCREEAAANALIAAVLLRGTQKHPDLRDITRHLDDLYGASVATLVRRVGDYQTSGFYCSFTEDRFVMDGDAVLEPMIDFVGELLLQPRLQDGGFYPPFVEGEKRNTLAALEAQKNDKRVYATKRLLDYMCKEDPLGIPRLGEPEQVMALQPDTLYAHYQKMLRESHLDFFYVGSREPQEVARLLLPIVDQLERNYQPLPAQTPFCDGGKSRNEETMEVTQGRLQMGFVSPSTIGTEDFAPMQVLNMVFGAGMTSKLFMQVREKMSLCYDIGSSYQGAKGILTVSVGMEHSKAEIVEAEILHQLEECKKGNITQQELESARQAMLSALRGTPDSAASIENYFAIAALSGLNLTLQQYMQQVEQVTVEKLAQLAAKLELHSVFLLKGVQ